MSCSNSSQNHLKDAGTPYPAKQRNTCMTFPMTSRVPMTWCLARSRSLSCSPSPQDHLANSQVCCVSYYTFSWKTIPSSSSGCLQKMYLRSLILQEMEPKRVRPFGEASSPAGGGGSRSSARLVAPGGAWRGRIGLVAPIHNHTTDAWEIYRHLGFAGRLVYVYAFKLLIHSPTFISSTKTCTSISKNVIFKKKKKVMYIYIYIRPNASLIVIWTWLSLS